MNLNDLRINPEWTLFLDRDGVINRRLVNDYVKTWDEFEFLPGVPEALRLLSGCFKKILVVTNQQGIGKGIVLMEAVRNIHALMVKEIQRTGGRIDGIYLSPYLEREAHPFRKPDTGMALAAKNDHPCLDFARSVMVGDSESDMEFGRRMGMVTVFIGEKSDFSMEKKKPYDFLFKDLLTFAGALIKDPEKNH
jgi:histidinol-phosphate phosphatase family protein